MKAILQLLVRVLFGGKPIQTSVLVPPPPEDVEKRLCVVCSHVEIGSLGVIAAKCNAPKNLRFDPVSGEKNRIWEYCSTQRNITGRGEFCCMDGAWFIPAQLVKLERAK